MRRRINCQKAARTESRLPEFWIVWTLAPDRVIVLREFRVEVPIRATTISPTRDGYTVEKPQIPSTSTRDKCPKDCIS